MKLVVYKKYQLYRVKEKTNKHTLFYYNVTLGGEHKFASEKFLKDEDALNDAKGRISLFESGFNKTY